MHLQKVTAEHHDETPPPDGHAPSVDGSSLLSTFVVTTNILFAEVGGLYIATQSVLVTVAGTGLVGATGLALVLAVRSRSRR